MAIKLIKDDLSIDNRNLRLDLISNFKIIEENLNQLLADSSNATGLATKTDVVDAKNSSKDNTNKQIEKLAKRINRIVVGTDTETVEMVVTEILKEKGVIK